MKTDWFSCDGRGHADKTAVSSVPQHHAEQMEVPQPPRSFTLSRRQALFGVGLGAVAWAARDATALADIAVNPGRRELPHDVLVTIFLRGGADGLNIVVPYGDDAYGRNRPTIGVAAPKSGKVSLAERALDLDGFFGLHPSLAPLHALYGEGLLSFVHACGSGDSTRSHFEAMSAMERGLPDDRGVAANGWLARHLAATQGESDSPLRAIAFSSVMPDALRGATGASALDSLADFRLYLPAAPSPEAMKTSTARDRDAHLRRALAALYHEGGDAVTRAGRETLLVLESLNRIDPANYRPARGASYPDSDLGSGLRQVACLIKAGVGLEVACLDHGGWDTHVAQTGTGGAMATLMDNLGKSLAAFARDMGDGMKRTTVVVMTEFGRRLQENSGLGTDHGRAGALMLLGGGVAGGKVFARWPGLADDQLEPPGDLRVTTDYRDVLAEIVARRLGNKHLSSVFPNHTPHFPGVVKSRRVAA